MRQTQTLREKIGAIIAYELDLGDLEPTSVMRAGGTIQVEFKDRRMVRIIVQEVIEIICPTCMGIKFTECRGDGLAPCGGHVCWKCSGSGKVLDVH